MITVHDCLQGTDAWHELRSGKYTGSNAHKLLTAGGKKVIADGASTLYALTGTDEFGGNFYTKRGHILEEEAIELYEAIKRQKVERPGFVTNTSFPACGYSPDGIVPDATIEVKCFNQAKHMAIYGGEIPLTVMAQLHFGMLICGKALARLVIYNPELDPKLAFKIIEVKARRPITKNFNQILTNNKVTA